MLGAHYPTLILTMLSCRLRWYALATSRMLRRHWQALLLSLTLLLPAMPVLAQTHILGAPVLEALAPSHSVEWRFAWVHLLEAVGVLWILAQRTAIVGGPFVSFLESLPVPNSRRRFVDTVVVLVASTPLLLPMVAAAIALAFLPHKAINYLFVLALFAIALGWQLTALSRTPLNAIALSIANAFLAGGMQIEGVIRPVLLIASLLLAGLAIAHTASPKPSSRWNGQSAFSRCVKNSIRISCRSPLSPFARLQLGILLDRATATLARCLVMGAVTVCACLLLTLWSFDTRAVPLTLISQAAIALIAATTYRDLKAAHSSAAHFVRSLPVAAAAKARADCLTVAALALPFAAIAPLTLVAHGVLSIGSAVALLLSGTPLLAMLYLPQRYASRQSPLLGIILAVAWVAAAWRFFVY